jgi:isoamylase
LFLSQGVPMLLAGDEMGRTQAGNNNAYCQDNEVSWVDWSLAQAEQDLLQFTETLAGLRRDHRVFRRRRFFRGRRGEPGDETSDIIWLTPGGQEMTQADWGASYANSLAVFLNGEAISEPDPRGEQITDAKFLLLFNANSNPLTFTLPEAGLAPGWEVVIATGPAAARAAKGATRPRPRSQAKNRGPGPLEVGAAVKPKSEVEVPARSTAVLQSTD